MSRKLNSAIIFMNNKHGINTLIELGPDSASVINDIKRTTTKKQKNKTTKKTPTHSIPSGIF